MKKLGTTKNYNGNIYTTKEIRKNLDIKDDEILEIFTENNSIILKKILKQMKLPKIAHDGPISIKIELFQLPM